ncbi:hypothetical protein AO973_09155 [Pseudomonas aeruginosa]|nr:hypothetical protein AO952_09020 [Pseudomonas aeruginosa]KSH71407.1 hypothetical protein AO973_09155 [Pseudomonas aeruginosa]
MSSASFSLNPQWSAPTTLEKNDINSISFALSILPVLIHPWTEGGFTPNCSARAFFDMFLASLAASIAAPSWGPVSIA